MKENSRKMMRENDYPRHATLMNWSTKRDHKPMIVNTRSQKTRTQTTQCETICLIEDTRTAIGRCKQLCKQIPTITV